MNPLKVVALAALFFASSLHAQDVTRQYDRNTDFSRFHTFKWVEIEGGSGISQITAANVKSAINTQLAAKGMALVADDQQADVFVAYQASVSQHQELNWYNSGGYWMGGMGSTVTTTVDVGTLVVDFYDPATKKLVWRGSATKTLKPSGDADKNYENLQKAVKKLLREFPPPVKR